MRTSEPMTDVQAPRTRATRHTRRVTRTALLMVAAAGSGLVLSGCEVTSYLDPSVMTRANHTPTLVPILSNLPALEGPANEGVEYSKILPEDLIPDVAAYRLGPGDGLEIDIQDLIIADRPEKLDRDVDARGYVDLPQAPSIYVLNKTVEQAQEAISAALRERKLLQNPVVSLVVRVRRQLAFNIIGGVAQPGQYTIAKPDFRLLEALSQAGRFNENISYVYVVRQVPLSDRVTGRPPAPNPDQNGAVPPPMTPATPTKPTTPTQPAKPQENIIDLIDELSKPTDPKPMSQPGEKPSPAIYGMQPATDSSKTTIDLPDSTAPAQPSQPWSAPSPNSGIETPEGPDWVFINGQWVRAARRDGKNGIPATEPMATTPPGAVDQGNAAADLFTQRVVQVPMGPLLAGSAQYNIIIRPGDIIRVPSPSEGLVYVAGEVARPGPYNLPASGKLTALRAITAAGGLSQTAIPERADIIRMVGPERQGMMRINLRAINAGTQPDIFLKPDDQINVGTNFFAFPLAVLKNGLRASYGFGFILDRNFGFDVFGPQRTNGL